ncbi:hypothetical protein N7481_006885 [Penicillium waksmanii]|uniref:uncharacterized protein n=1 Tax=Penicillium waksmanii TaxID=69791 RepID=UPI0025481AEA|nr:uncharacterized protein N7481_006885 [Penicillium waksmanii]KAJ5979587.1 hypothetical protein N7481_006885 [Penicillium waksmanii]
MHLILTGATGLVGSGVLDAMLQNSAISRISILSRRPVKMAEDAKDPRVHVITHKDFETYQPELLEQLKDADGCVWALGISQNSVDKEQYVKITKDYALAAANAFSTLKPANPPFPIHPLKGETESLLGDISAKHPGTFQVDSVRPAGVDPTGHDAIKPYLPDQGFLYKAMGVVLMPIIKNFYKSFHSPTPELGSFLTQLAMGKMDSKMQGPGVFRLGGGYVVENKAVRRMMAM